MSTARPCALINKQIELQSDGAGANRSEYIYRNVHK